MSVCAIQHVSRMLSPPRKDMPASSMAASRSMRHTACIKDAPSAEEGHAGLHILQEVHPPFSLLDSGEILP